MSTQTELFDLSGKVALICGGASGIGLAIAEAFVRHGAQAVIGSRTQEKVEEAATHLDGLANTSGDDVVATGVTIDVTNQHSIEHAVRKAMDVFGGLHILVNCAGIHCKKPTFDLTENEFNDLYNLHVTGSLRAAQVCGHIFREQHDGCIINLASISSFVDLVEVAAYAAAKNAVLGLTRSLANEWVKYGVRTNAIAPGFVVTDLNRQNLVGTDRGRRILERTPAARFGQASEMAGTVVYLASPAATFVNGQTIVVDGGFLACGFTDSVAGEQ